MLDRGTPLLLDRKFEFSGNGENSACANSGIKSSVALKGAF